MNKDMKEKLLLRMFSSIEYMGKFVEHFVTAMDTAEAGIAAYKKQPPTDPKLLSEYKPEIYQWESKVLPNFLGMKKNALEALTNAQKGQLSTMRSCTGNLRGLGKDMDGIGEEWWQAVDPKLSDSYATNLRIARRLGANIYYTLSNFWENDEILDKGITGPIDEQELLKYLKSGEMV